MKAVSRAERLQFVAVDLVGYLVKRFAQLRIAVRVVPAFQHPVHRVVKIPPRRFEVSRFVIGFARSELRLHLFDQIGNPTRRFRQQGNHFRRRQLPLRQFRNYRHFRLLLRHRPQRGSLRLHRLFRRVLARAQTHDRHHSKSSGPCRRPPRCPLAHLSMVRTPSHPVNAFPPQFPNPATPLGAPRHFPPPLLGDAL